MSETQSTLRKAANPVVRAESERDNASKQAELARASMSSSIYFNSSLRSQNERRNRYLLGQEKHTGTHEAAQLVWCAKGFLPAYSNLTNNT